jgi:CheY-like chemotaxis protein
MIVDDDYDIRDALSQILGDEGYECLAAANGREALDVLARAAAAPGMILLDLMMPVMNGWQFRAKQRENAAIAAIPVVVISADSNVAEKAAALGVDAWLRKPIELDALLALTVRFCG